MPKKSNKNEFIEKATKIHNNKYDYSKVEYTNNKTKVCIICPEHGEFWQTPHNHLKGYGCSSCGKSIRFSTNDFIKRAESIHGNKYDYSKCEYAGSIKKSCIICPEHGEFWQAPYLHLRGCGCPKCSGKDTTTVDFVYKARKIHGDKYDYTKTEYKNNKTKVCIICPEHGEFWQLPKHHLNGYGCQKCSEPRLETEIRVFLEENNIQYIKNCNKNYFGWLGRQHLDFYLPDHKVAIECQGEEHFFKTNFGAKSVTPEEAFMDVIRRDEKKRKLCLENNIVILYYSNLGIIYPYKVYENKEFLLNEIKGNGR